MARYRRWFVPGGSYFFTVVTYQRMPFLCDELARTILREKIRECQASWPFTMEAIVLLPDHLHAIWTLPPGDDGFSQRWGWIKKEFTKNWIAVGGPELHVSPGKRKHRRHGVWQPRFWEHLLRDEDDLEAYMDYLHYNPVKHGLVACPKDWPYSSFQKWVGKGVYTEDWGCPSQGAVLFPALDEDAIE